jgi:catechol 2,3-dioxygenase-like lactoylglutathione lyase family enzyme
MLGNKTAVTVIATKDLNKAKQFYEGTLGLQPVGDEAGGAIYKSGSSSIFVYESEFAGTNKATVVSWGVGDELEKLVSALKGKGVAFEHYDIPGATVDGDIHVMGKLKSAWFKDPDGNILNLVNDM